MDFSEDEPRLWMLLIPNTLHTYWIPSIFVCIVFNFGQNEKRAFFHAVKMCQEQSRRFLICNEWPLVSDYNLVCTITREYFIWLPCWASRSWYKLANIGGNEQQLIFAVFDYAIDFIFDFADFSSLRSYSPYVCKAQSEIQWNHNDLFAVHCTLKNYYYC